MRHLLLLALLLGTSSVFTQSVHRFHVGLAGGFGFTGGDVQNDFTGYDVSGRVGLYATPAVGFFGEFGFARIQGRNDDRRQAFASELTRYNAGIQFNLLQILRIDHVTDRLAPYIGVGFGVTRANVLEQTDFTGAYHDDLYATISPEFGALVRLTDRLDLNVRYQMGFMGTDLMDGYDPPGSTRNDVFSNLSIGLNLNIGRGDHHIRWTVEDRATAEDMPDARDADRARTDSLMNLAEQRTIDVQRSLTEEIDRLRQRIDLQQKTIASQNELLRTMNTVGSDRPDTANDTMTFRPGRTPGASVNAPEATPLPVVNPGEDRFFVIVGSFGVSANADAKVSQLLAAGYEARTIRVATDDLIRVAAASSDDEAMIRSALSQIRSDLMPSAWVLRNTNR